MDLNHPFFVCPSLAPPFCPQLGFYGFSALDRSVRSLHFLATASSLCCLSGPVRSVVAPVFRHLPLIFFRYGAPPKARIQRLPYAIIISRRHFVDHGVLAFPLSLCMKLWANPRRMLGVRCLQAGEAMLLRRGRGFHSHPSLLFLHSNSVAAGDRLLARRRQDAPNSRTAKGSGLRLRAFLSDPPLPRPPPDSLVSLLSLHLATRK